MKKPVSAFIFILLLPAVATHPGHGDAESNSTDDSGIDDVNSNTDSSSFEELAESYKTGTGWVIAEIVLVMGATVLAVRHYSRRSDGDDNILQKTGIGGSK